MDTLQIISILIPSILSFLGGYFLYKMRASVVKLRKIINTQTLASSYSDDFWGDIQVLHNNKRINNLHFMKIDIFNSSNKDIDDFVILINSGNNNKILSSHAINNDSKIILNHTDGFNNQVKLKNWNYLNENREFQALVLNRNTHITISLVIESDSSEIDQEEFIVGIEKKGVKLIPINVASDEQTALWSIFLGVVLVIITAVICFILFPESKVPIVILGFIGSFSFIIGALVYYSIEGRRYPNYDITEED